MTTEVLTPENTFLWTSNVRKDKLPRCHKKSLAFKQIPARLNNNVPKSYYKKVTRPSSNLQPTISPR